MSTSIEAGALVAVMVVAWPGVVRAETAVTDLGAGTTSAYSSVEAAGDLVHVVTWADAGNGNTEVFYRRSMDRGMTFEPSRRLTDAVGASQSPSIAVAGSSVFVAWADDRAGNFEIYVKRSTDGGITWSSDTRVTNAGGDSRGPSIAVSGTNVYVTWNDRRDGNLEVYFRKGRADLTSWDAEQRLSESPVSSSHPVLAISDSSIHLAWEEGSFVAYRRSLDGGRLWEPQRQISHPSGYLVASKTPSVTAAGQDVQVYFMDSRSGGCLFGCYQVWRVTSTDGGATWAQEARLFEEESTSDQVTARRSGSVVRLAFTSHLASGMNTISYGRSLDGGQSWDPRTVIAEEAGRLDRTSLAFSNGRALFAWTKAPNEADVHAFIARRDEGPDLDIADNGLDVQHNTLLLAGGRPETGRGPRVVFGHFLLVNTTANANPDPDGPSESTSISLLKPTASAMPRSPEAVARDLGSCLHEAEFRSGTPSPRLYVSFMDLVAGPKRTIPAAVAVPASLPRGARAHGDVLACVVRSVPAGEYRQEITVSGTADGTITADRFVVRFVERPPGAPF